MNSHLFVWLCLLSMEIRLMNIHLGTGGEPQASQMSNPSWVFSHSVGHFMHKCGKPCHTIIHKDGGVVSMWVGANDSGQPQHQLFSHKLQWLTTTIFHVGLQRWVNEKRRDYLQGEEKKEGKCGRPSCTIHIDAALNNPPPTQYMCLCCKHP